MSTAFVTASYGPDFERCRLLCETMDELVTGQPAHYLLVEAGDVPLFRQLQSGNRRVIDERELLPSWLRSWRDPFSLFRRRIWLSSRTAPLRGWHVQQLRRIAIAEKVPESVLAYTDSDVAFVKPFDTASFVRQGNVRLFRRSNELAGKAGTDHVVWSRNAGAALGIGEPATSPHDYIATLIAWRASSVIAMCRRIEAVHGKHWVETVASVRKFSECMLYGRFVDEVLEGDGHFTTSEELCRVHWQGTPMNDAEFAGFVATMAPEQVAIGMQSFIGTDIARIRRLIGV
jgi:hypothetical protein